MKKAYSSLYLTKLLKILILNAFEKSVCIYRLPGLNSENALSICLVIRAKFLTVDKPGSKSC